MRSRYDMILRLNRQRTTRCFFVGRGLVPFVPITTVAGGVACLRFCCGVTLVTDSSSSLFFPRFWERSVGVCSGGTGFVVTGVGTGGRPTRLEGAGLGVVVRVPRGRSACAGVGDVCCGKLPRACDFASFLSSFCKRPLSVSRPTDQE